MFVMRYLAFLLASPAAAWEFSPSPVCTLYHQAPGIEAEVTFDGSFYAIHLTRDGGWPDAPVFSIAFQPNGPTISTSRHAVSGDTLTVTDSGFGNVLNGLEFNSLATAILGATTQPIDLDGAAPEVAAFRDCPATPSV